MNFLSGYRTIVAASVALAGEVMRQFGIELDAEGLTNSVMIIGGTIAAIIFRVKATKVF